MTEKVKALLDTLRAKEYRKNRVELDIDLTDEIEKSIDPQLLDTEILERMLEGETPNFVEGDIFGFNRRQNAVPYYYDYRGRKKTGGPGNITPNYARIISVGYDKVLADIEKYEKINTSEENKVFYEAIKRSMAASLKIAEDYRVAAIERGDERLADALSRVPHGKAESFYDALVFFKFIIYTLRCSHATHLTLGRFDQYMYPYYQMEIDRGVSRDEIFEMLELWFLSINIDPDIYFGVQQGDNGQSMVLGGFDKDGIYQFNELSEMCLKASEELCLIDPKINIRVGKNTPDRIYALGTKLTKKGLGFPQYLNDDLIIPYMISLGYDEADAYDYTVAACWEVLSPYNGFDVPNCDCFSFPHATARAIRTYLKDCPDFESLMDKMTVVMKEDADDLIASRPQGPRDFFVPHNMYLSIFADGCIEKGLDVTKGGVKYYNLGMLGAGIANATDALAAVKKVIFEDKLITPDQLFEALDANFEGYDEIRNLLLSAPKMGNNDDYADSIAARLMDIAADNFHGRPTGFLGGVWRAGTGRAQNYIVKSATLKATADGRKDYEPYSCSFSPSISTRTAGPLSVIQSFTKFDMSRMCNGGPVTIELHDTVFRNEEGEKKVAELVKIFIMLGGHQLQLNAINRDVLLEAKENPEDHQNLIVRVWGWSGYFCELDPEYQDHIISRVEYTM